MKKLSKLSLAIVSTLLSLNMAHASNGPTTFLGPTLQLGFTNALTDNTAYSLLGEAGVKNFRVGGTLGWKIATNQLFKVSVDYLWQDVDYSFFTGNTDQWVQQGSLGAAYEYDLLGYNYNPALSLTGYLSHAPSKSLSTRSGILINSLGLALPYTDVRRIAGSNAGGLAPGASASFWPGSRLGVALNYDDVRYDQVNGGPNENAQGFGGTIFLNQALTQDINLGLAAAFRQPFDNYAANLNYTHFQYYGDWTLGVFADYTTGRDSLPNTWNAGFSADYFLDRRCPVALPRMNMKGEADLKGEAALVPISDNLLAWTSTPAVYLPQVLAITDGKIVSACSLGSIVSRNNLPNVVRTVPSAPEFITYETARNFTGTVTHYSINVVRTGFPAGDTITINPVTGAISIHLLGTALDVGTFTVTVIASNGCFTTASNTFTVTTVTAA